ncbi:lipopolysaccharide biosynthesis protein [Streptomyces fradiae]|uniref:Tyrosine-protein kinase ptk n=3 Tax=Streptomyces TaxID=1883 RepID=A0A1Y2P4E8_STRFR|nr:lipopolysaccharide biosynthesis protein [Streptomyces fradiae]OSY54109.1 Tyrosine-protein kinase ptk [Streptomyces fradiae ATCC 10745 = DSM 40063]
MTQVNGGQAAAPPILVDDEPDLLRDQFRQLLRYPRLIAGGVLLGLLGGAWLGYSTSDTYVATSDVVLRVPMEDPFNPSVAIEKTLDMNTERQAATSRRTAERAAAELDFPGDPADLVAGLQVTNPPKSQVLRFSYTTADPGLSARRANAMVSAYLADRREQTAQTRDTMIKGLQAQLAPIARQHDELAEELDGRTGPEAEGDYAVKANLLGRITELSNRISKLKALDISPGKVIRTATPPTSSDGPGWALSLGLGGAVGIALGLLMAWVRLVFDPAARSEGDVARALRAPVLGSLPRTRDTDPLLTEDREDSPLAEEYRSIAYRLAYDQRFAGRRRLLVAAPRGSSRTAAAVAVNLAASFAETGKRVLIVEAELRQPSLEGQLRAREVGRTAWPGDGEGEDWPGGRRLVVDAGESGGFDLVPGARVRNVARALTSPEMSRLVEEADDPNVTVIVLTPPVFAYADALALVDRVDGVLVVCDPRGVHRSQLARLRDLITGAGGTVLGTVMHRGQHSGRTGRGGRKKAGNAAGARSPRGTPGTPGAPGAPGAPGGHAGRGAHGSPGAPGPHAARGVQGAHAAQGRPRGPVPRPAPGAGGGAGGGRAGGGGRAAGPGARTGGGRSGGPDDRPGAGRAGDDWPGAAQAHAADTGAHEDPSTTMALRAIDPPAERP